MFDWNYASHYEWEINPKNPVKEIAAFSFIKYQISKSFHVVFLSIWCIISWRVVRLKSYHGKIFSVFCWESYYGKIFSVQVKFHMNFCEKVTTLKIWETAEYERRNIVGGKISVKLLRSLQTMSEFLNFNFIVYMYFTNKAERRVNRSWYCKLSELPYFLIYFTYCKSKSTLNWRLNQFWNLFIKIN